MSTQTRTELPAGRAFADELLAVAPDRPTREALEAVLRRWRGARLSVAVPTSTAASTAVLMARAGVDRGVIVARLRASGMSRSAAYAHARRALGPGR